ncbi:MAG: TetR-like C-terminal domain-containing protein [Clostridium sp.]
MEMDAVKEQHGEQAVRILADTYRLFAKEHRQLYWLIMNTAAKDHQVLDNAAILITDPLKKIFQDFHLQNKELVHYRRLFRAIVHGFISQEEEGFFSHYPTPVEESFYFSIQCFIDCLKQGEMRCLHNERKK